MAVSILLKNIYENYFLQLLLFSLILIFAGVLETTALIFLAPILDSILGNDLIKSSFLTQKIHSIFEYFNLEVQLEILFLIFILSTIFTALFSTLCVYYSEKIKYSYGYELMSKTLKNLYSLKWSFFTKVKQGSLLNTFSRELQAIINTLSVFARMIANFVQFLVIGILPFLISWQLVIIMILTLIIVFFPLMFLAKKARSVGEQETLANKILLSHLQESFSGLKVILGNSLQEIVKLEILKKFITQIKITIIRVVLFTSFSNAVLPLMAIGFTILYYFSFNFLNIKIVELTVIIAAFVRMTSKLGLIVKDKAVLEASLASLKELNLINNIKKKLIVKNGSKNLGIFKSKIEFKDVDYSYDNKNIVLKKCKLNFVKGKIIGITGESGSGKSTIVDLIMGFDFPNKGKIKIDNVNIENLDLNDYRKKIGYISQDTVLFNTTVLKNILWTNSDAKKYDVEKLISKSKAFNFIKKLPNGLNTLVGDRGVSLSGGQIQRIALLRALIKNPQILILDEGTSALDEKNEKHIMDFLFKLKKIKTIIIVAHRLFTLKKVDMLYILKDGKIIEKGSYLNLKTNKRSNFNKMLNAQKNN